MKFLVLILLNMKSYALEVIRHDFYQGDIELRIVQVQPYDFETMKLINENHREMRLVCAYNRAYDSNDQPFILFRNYYGVNFYRFTFPSQKLCQELYDYLMHTHLGIDEEDPLRITLSKKDFSVKRIVYPSVDPFAMDGDWKDFLPKDKVKVTPDHKNNELKIEILN